MRAFLCVPCPSYPYEVFCCHLVIDKPNKSKHSVYFIYMYIYVYLYIIHIYLYDYTFIIKKHLQPQFCQTPAAAAAVPAA